MDTAVSGMPTDRSRRPFAIASVELAGEAQSVRTDEVLRLPGGVLTVFTRREPVTRQALVVAPLSGAYALLMRDLILVLLREADRVAVTDWRDQRFVPHNDPSFGLDDNVLHVAAMMAVLGEPRPHVVAVCQGSIPALAATALAAEEEEAAREPASLTLIAAPIDPSVRPTRTAHLACAHPVAWFEEHAVKPVPPGFPGSGRRVYPRETQSNLFWSYLSRHLASASEVAWKVWADDGEDPVRFGWLPVVTTLMDLPAAFFLDNIERVFQSRQLATGRFRVAGRPVDLRAIRRTHLVTIEGEWDDIAAAGQSAVVHDLCASLPANRHGHSLVRRAGHFSLFHGRTLRTDVAPVLAAAFEAGEQAAA